MPEPIKIAGDPVPDGLVTCGDPGQFPCDFNAFILMLNNIIDWIIGISVIIATISFIWGGFLWLTSGAKPANKDKAKDILLNTLWGFLLILTAWLIIYTILTYLTPANIEGKPNSIFQFLKK